MHAQRVQSPQRVDLKPLPGADHLGLDSRSDGARVPSLRTPGAAPRLPLLYATFQLSDVTSMCSPDRDEPQQGPVCPRPVPRA